MTTCIYGMYFALIAFECCGYCSLALQIYSIRVYNAK